MRVDKDKAFVIHFDREMELLQDLTSSRQKLNIALEKLDNPEFSRAVGEAAQSVRAAIIAAEVPRSTTPSSLPPTKSWRSSKVARRSSFFPMAWTAAAR